MKITKRMLLDYLAPFSDDIEVIATCDNLPGPFNYRLSFRPADEFSEPFIILERVGSVCVDTGASA